MGTYKESGGGWLKNKKGGVFYLIWNLKGICGNNFIYI